MASYERKYLQVMYLMEVNIQNIQRTCTTQQLQYNNGFKKWAKELNRRFSEEEIQVTNNHLKDG